MSQLINLSNYKPEQRQGVAVSNHELAAPVVAYSEDEYKLTLNILVHNNPQKVLFTPKETALNIGVGEEFVRRRIKNGTIKATYIGDKPMINITELSRIIIEGIK